VFFVIDLKTRRVHVAGPSNSPDGAWMAQVARNLTDAASGVLKDARHLIVDRDPLYTAHFKAILASANVGAAVPAGAKPELERLRRAFRRVDQVRVPVSRRADSRAAPSSRRSGIRRSTITTSAITKASTTSSRCRSGNPALGQPGKGAIRRHERFGGVLIHYRREAA
jgi:putative transposase